MSSEHGVGLDEGKHLVQRSHGYAIAEFAMAIPALLIVVSMAISLIGVTVTQIKLESSAALGARIIGRGDPIPDSFRNALPKETEIIIESDVEAEVVQFTLKTNRNIGLILLPYRIDVSASARARLEPVFEEFG